MQWSFRHLTTVLQIHQLDIEKTIGFYEKEIKNKEDKQRLHQRAVCVKNWLEKYAGDDMKFEVQDKVKAKLSSKQKQALLELKKILQKKKIAVENNLQEILYSTNNKLRKSTDSEIKLNSEIKEYENRLTELNTSIKESINELVELKTSLANIKLEHEEHQTGITKLVSMKKKLQQEISKHQAVVKKYQKISEKIRFEQAMKKKETTSKIEETTSGEDVNIGKAKNPGDQFLKV